VLFIEYGVLIGLHRAACLHFLIGSL